MIIFSVVGLLMKTAKSLIFIVVIKIILIKFERDANVIKIICAFISKIERKMYRIW